MPSGPFDAIQDHVRRLHQMAGWPGIVYNYSQASDDGSSDWHDDTGGGDAGWTDDGGEAVTIRVETGTSPETERDPAGRIIEGDAIVTVDPSEHSAGKAGFTDGEGEAQRATEIVDGDSGQRYRVLRVLDEHNGVLTLDSEQI